MREKFGRYEEVPSPDDMAKKMLKAFEEEEMPAMEAGNVGILQHDLEAKVTQLVRETEKNTGKGDADLLARHILFHLNAAQFEGDKIETKSDFIKEKAINFLRGFLEE